MQGWLDSRYSYSNYSTFMKKYKYSNCSQYSAEYVRTTVGIFGTSLNLTDYLLPMIPLRVVYDHRLQMISLHLQRWSRRTAAVRRASTPRGRQGFDDMSLWHKPDDRTVVHAHVIRRRHLSERETTPDAAAVLENGCILTSYGDVICRPSFPHSSLHAQCKGGPKSIATTKFVFHWFHWSVCSTNWSMESYHVNEAGLFSRFEGRRSKRIRWYRILFRWPNLWRHQLLFVKLRRG